MRVVLVGPYPRDAGQPLGGVEASIVNLLEGFRAFPDIHPHVVTFVRGGRTRLDRDDQLATVTYLPGRERLNNVTFYRSDRRRLSEALAELRPDIAHGQDAIGYGYVTLKAAGDVPVVLSIHGIVREELRHMVNPTDKIRASIAPVRVQNYCIRHARYLLAPSRYPEEYFRSRIGGSIIDVGNAISDRFFAVSPAPEAGRVLYAGGITPGKRVLDLVDALSIIRRELPGATLRLAGHTDDRPYVEAVRDRARSLGLDEQVTFLGNVSTEELVEEYRAASLLVLPSAQENSPMVIREAMAVGVPVVATRVGGVAWLVDDGQTGFLVDVGDVEATARRSIEILGDESRQAALGEAARVAAAHRFRARDVAARVREVYLRALEQSSTNRAPALTARG
jgi:glycosyltransferase involved in cell wall biosynthesis